MHVSGILDYNKGYNESFFSRIAASRLSVPPFVYLFICLYVWLPAYSSIHLSVCLSFDNEPPSLSFNIYVDKLIITFNPSKLDVRSISNLNLCL